MGKKILFKLPFSIFLLLPLVSATTTRAEWSAMQTGTPFELRGIWGSAATDVFVVGVGGVILHYDGNREGIWYPMQNSSS